MCATASFAEIAGDHQVDDGPRQVVPHPFQRVPPDRRDPTRLGRSGCGSALDSRTYVRYHPDMRTAGRSVRAGLGRLPQAEGAELAGLVGQLTRPEVLGQLSDAERL